MTKKRDWPGGPIRRAEIRKLRKQIRMGDILRMELKYDRDGERLVVPVREEMRVTGVYPYLVTMVPVAEEHGYARQTSLTYPEILIGKRWGEIELDELANFIRLTEQREMYHEKHHKREPEGDMLFV